MYKYDEYCSFSKYLMNYCSLDLRNKTVPTTVRELMLLKPVLTHYALTVSNDECDDEILYLIATNKHIRNVRNWLNENILFKIDVDSYESTHVKIRIVTSMINKLEYDGVIPNYLSYKIVENIRQNVEGIQRDFNLEDLPFLPHRLERGI